MQGIHSQIEINQKGLPVSRIPKTISSNENMYVSKGFKRTFLIGSEKKQTHLKKPSGCWEIVLQKPPKLGAWKPILLACDCSFRCSQGIKGLSTSGSLKIYESVLACTQFTVMHPTFHFLSLERLPKPLLTKAFVLRSGIAFGCSLYRFTWFLHFLPLSHIKNCVQTLLEVSQVKIHSPVFQT